MNITSVGSAIFIIPTWNDVDDCYGAHVSLGIEQLGRLPLLYSSYQRCGHHCKISIIIPSEYIIVHPYNNKLICGDIIRTLNKKRQRKENQIEN